MFQATRMLFLYVETPLHAGTGRGLGTVDLPIQRDRTTHYPLVHASGLKGALRAETKEKLDLAVHLAIFGPEDPDKASEHAGALAVADARTLLFPVRSLAGVFAWVTSAEALARFRRDAAMVNLMVGWIDELKEVDKNKNACLINGDTLKAGDSVVLEEFSFAPQQAGVVGIIGKWLADNALPQGSEYAYWRNALPNKLCILPEDAFRDFVQYGTEVQTHVKLDSTKKTVVSGALWTSESLPTDTLLYAPLMATGSRTDRADLTANQVLGKLTGLEIKRIQLGGDETTGQGVVALRFIGGA